MSRMFLDPDKPLSTCEFKNCKSCELNEKIVCHFDGKHLGKFFIFAFLPMIVGGYNTFTYRPLFLFIWIGMFLLFFGLFEIRVLCSHCPHYAEPGERSLKCWANYGSPKIWKYRPYPMSFFEKLVFIGGVTAIFGYPAPFFILKGTTLSYVLGGVYAVLVTLFLIMLRTQLCTVCMNFFCPLNRVDKETKEKFIAKNPRAFQKKK